METEVRQRGPRPGDRPQALLRIYLLGRFEVVRADTPIPPHAWRRRRPADLLKLVALAPGRSLSREQVVDALWPDKDPASGANNLHRALYDLRQVLGGRWIDIERGQVRLRADAWVDVDAFERAVGSGPDARPEAVALYRGDLVLDDAHDPHGGAHARSIVARRAALRARFVEAALPLARSSAAEGRAEVAVPLLRRVVEVDRSAEDAHRLLMRLLAESGRRSEALRQYDACELSLRATGLGPSDETRQLRAAIQAGEVGPARSRPPLDGALRAARRLLGAGDPLPVRGRGPLLLVLESLVEQGAGAVVLLGESGVGKTRLALEGARIAQGRGAVVLCGIAGTTPGMPYGLFQDALRDEARVNPDVPDPFAAANALAGGVAGEDVRLAISEGMERALRAVAGGRPLFLLLDDLHLADESSLNLVHLVARHARALRLMIVATCNEEAIHGGTPLQTALAHLDCARLARGVRVPRLAMAAMREQVQDLAGDALDEVALARIYRATDGSPLLVEQIVRGFRDSEGALLPPDAPSAVRARVARLGPNAETILAAAAVAGVRFEFEPVRAVSGLSAHEAVAALETCLEARLVHGDGTGYHFHHVLVRDAVYAGLAEDRRRGLHAALADALEASAGVEPPSELLAHHRRRAGQDGRALAHLVAAGHRAAARAGLCEALAFYGEALELAAPEDGPARLELLDATGRVQLGLGELGGAARSFQQAARLAVNGFRPDEAARAAAHRLAALALAGGGHLRAAHAELDEGLATVEQGGDDESRGPLLHVRAQLLCHEGRHAEARAAAERCADVAARAGDTDLSLRGHDLAALARAAMGAPLPPPPPAPPGPARHEPSGVPPLDLHLALWDRDLVTGDCAAVLHLARLLGERAAQRHAPDVAAVGRLGQGAAELAMGRLDEAEAALREAIQGHRAAGCALGEALSLERLALVFTVRGWLDEALDLLGEAVVVAERATLRRHALTRVHAAEARNRLAAGALYAAEDALREASEAAARHGECVACDTAFRPEAVRVLLARGRLAEADHEAALLEDVAARRGGRVLAAFAATARGRVLAAHGDARAALATLAGARVAFADAGHRLEAARCARLEARVAGAALAIPPEAHELSALVTLDADV